MLRNSAIPCALGLDGSKNSVFNANYGKRRPKFHEKE
jgi:hypothetical protein